MYSRGIKSIFLIAVVVSNKDSELNRLGSLPTDFHTLIRDSDHYDRPGWALLINLGLLWWFSGHQYWFIT